MLGQIPNERLERCFVKALAHPIEGRTQIVHEFLARIRRSDLRRQIGCLSHVRRARFHPQKIRVRCEFLGPFDSRGETGTEVVESLPCTRNVA